VNVLFITRKFPPSIGGMEKVAYRLNQELSQSVKVSLLSFGNSQKFLAFFVIGAFFKSLFIVPSKKIDTIYIADGLLAPLGLLLKYITKKKIVITIHGLDITYQNKIYQAIIPSCVNRYDTVICISSATAKECTERGIDERIINTIPWGVYPNEFKSNPDKEELENIIGLPVSGKKIIITVGRLVERKGANWFIKNVMPYLQNSIYLIIGKGEDYQKINQTIIELSLNKDVKVLRNVTDNELKTIYSSSDLFVMPNIHVEGDIEGFGMVALEAASADMNIVLSNVDGIEEAAKCISNVVLVKPENKTKMLNAILSELSKPRPKQKVRSWQEVGGDYAKVFSNL
jgi:glycosyltransferase involved in cell wall biosynthesis